MSALFFCPRCKEHKERSAFYTRKGKNGKGRTSWCRRCHIKAVSALYTKEEIKLKNRRQNLKNKYGLTLEQYDCMCEEQDHCCFICGERTKLVVDHCHTTGEVRKLLCVSCNTGLGMFRDNPEFLNRAMEYVSSPN